VINNFEHIRERLIFDDEDRFYFVQIIKRRKEDASMEVGTKTIRTYFIDTMEYFDKKEEEIISLCEEFKARAMIKLNRRSYKKTAHKAMLDMVKKLDSGAYRACKTSYDTAASGSPVEEEKIWIVDIDPEEMEDLYEIMRAIDESQSKYEKNVVGSLPSKNGLHLLTRPFDVRDIHRAYPDIVKKDALTNLYIP
jgi:hypothetical protein